MAASPPSPAPPRSQWLSHDLAVRIAMFLSLDSLRCFGLVARGCRKVAQQEEARRPAIDIEGLDKIGELPFLLQRLYCDFVRHARESVVRPTGPRQPLIVPGMTLEESRDVDRAHVQFPSMHPCYIQRTQEHVTLRITWLAKEVAYGPDGRLGAAVGIARCLDSGRGLLSYGSFVNLGSGVSSVVFYLVTGADGQVEAFSWFVPLGEAAVYLTAETLVSKDRVIASHPSIFSRLVTYDPLIASQLPALPDDLRNVKLENPGRSIVAPHGSIRPSHVSIPHPRYAEPANPVLASAADPLQRGAALVDLITSHRVAFLPHPRTGQQHVVLDTVASLIQDRYVSPLDAAVSSLDSSVTMFSQRDLTSVLTTPKGLWHVATQFSELSAVDFRALWSERSSSLIQGFKRQWNRGFSDVWTSGMVPLYFLCSALCGAR